MNQSPIRLVCFDLGGVLIRICRSWVEGCAAAGIEIRGTCFTPDPDIQGWDDLARAFGMGRIDGEQWSKRSSQLLGGCYSPAEVRAIHDAWLLREYEGVNELIHFLHDAGLRTAALSNTNQDHWARMHEFPAVMKLQFRLASHELGLLKPDPAIYKQVEVRLNCLPSEILFFDDLQPNINAARSAGWAAHLIDPLGDPTTQMETVLINRRVLAAHAPTRAVKSLANRPARPPRRLTS